MGENDVMRMPHRNVTLLKRLTQPPDPENEKKNISSTRLTQKETMPSGAKLESLSWANEMKTMKL